MRGSGRRVRVDPEHNEPGDLRLSSRFGGYQIELEYVSGETVLGELEGDWGVSLRGPELEHVWNARSVLAINKIGFAPERRGRGWGRSFVEALERDAERRGAAGIVLVAAWLPQGPGAGAEPHSRGFWEAMGYYALVKLDRDERTALMWKRLPQSGR